MQDDLSVQVGLSEKRYIQALARIEAQTLRSAKTAETRFAKANRSTERGFQRVDASSRSAASGGLRMASMQLSQVAQQGAATGNYLQALAIQAPDLALGFGAIGIAAGALVPILYGVATAAFGAAEEVEKIDVQAAYGRATSAIEAVREAQDRYTAAIRLSGRAQSEVTPEILSSLRLEAQAREAMAALEVARLQRQRQALSQTLAADRAELERLLRDVSQGLDDGAAEEFVNSGAERARLQNTRDVLDANQELLLKIREQQAELDLVNALIAGGHGEAAKLVDELLNAEDAARSIGTTDLSAGIVAAHGWAVALSAALDQARAKKFDDITGGNPNFFDPRGREFGSPDAGVIFRPRGVPRQNQSGYTPPKSTTGSGARSGSGQADQEQNELLRERDRILRSIETANEKYHRDLVELDRVKAAGLLTDIEYNRALDDLNETLRDAEFSTVIDGIESFSDAIGNAIVNSEDLGEAVGSVLKRIAADIISSNIKGLLMDAFNIGGQGTGGIGASLGKWLGGVLTGRQGGGPVQAGTPVRVGEGGQSEVFVPEVNGRIVSASQLRDISRPGGGASALDLRVHTTVSVDGEGNLRAVSEAYGAQGGAVAGQRAVADSITAGRGLVHHALKAAGYRRSIGGA